MPEESEPETFEINSPVKTPTFSSVFAGGFDEVTYSLFKEEVECNFETAEEACEHLSYMDDALAAPTDEHGNTLLHAAAMRGDAMAMNTIFLAIERADADLAKEFLEKRNSGGRTALQVSTPNPTAWRLTSLHCNGSSRR